MVLLCWACRALGKNAATARAKMVRNRNREVLAENLISVLRIVKDLSLGVLFSARTG